MLENLQPAPKVDVPKEWRPAIEFNGEEGEATTQGFLPDEKPDFDKFLVEAGFDPKEIEIIGEPRTSRWQVARPFPLDPQWLTAYRFRFRKRASAGLDLPLLFAEAKKTKKPVVKSTNPDKCLVIAAADFQVGKVDHRGGTPELLERVMAAYDRIEALLKKNKYERVILADVGDIVENFASVASEQQTYSNDLSLMEQVDLATTLIWELVKRISKYSTNITYATIASNHCQFRINKQQVGQPGRDDWGTMIAKQISRLAKETGLPIKILVPQPHDESLAHDVFDDGFHILGLWHGHQSARPEQVPIWWEKQAFGLQPVAAATVALTGHWHHLRVLELGQASNGGSKFWIQASTMDSGSGWWRLRTGQDSAVGITCFELERNVPFSGTVMKL
jgi:hypothetical protein